MACINYCTSQSTLPRLTTPLPLSSSTHSYARVDILTHFEICELGASGQYEPVTVDHQNDQEGVFLLQQGLQRRIRMTLIYESGPELQWTKVSELVVGKRIQYSVFW